MCKYAIEVENVSMKFSLASERVDSLKEYFLKKVSHRIHSDDFWALKDISFKISKGDSFALIGSNGSGKSTLLKIIAGVLEPTIGKVSVRGAIAPLIELGAGFDPVLTGRENIFLNGAILGHSKKFMLEKYDEIMDFAEIKDFEDVPVKNYSSGMMARLGFSIATISKPDILLVDEILAVGDFAFQRKCQDRMQKLMEGGTTVVFVSHSFSDVERICKHAAWINKGNLEFVGDSKEACNRYEHSEDYLKSLSASDDIQYNIDSIWSPNGRETIIQGWAYSKYGNVNILLPSNVQGKVDRVEREDVVAIKHLNGSLLDCGFKIIVNNKDLDNLKLILKNKVHTLTIRV